MSRFCGRAGVEGGLLGAAFVSTIAAALDSFLYSLYFSAERNCVRNDRALQGWGDTYL